MADVMDDSPRRTRLNEDGSIWRAHDSSTLPSPPPPEPSIDRIERQLAKVLDELSQLKGITVTLADRTANIADRMANIEDTLNRKSVGADAAEAGGKRSQSDHKAMEKEEEAVDKERLEEIVNGEIRTTLARRRSHMSPRASSMGRGLTYPARRSGRPGPQRQSLGLWEHVSERFGYWSIILDGILDGCANAWRRPPVLSPSGWRLHVWRFGVSAALTYTAILVPMQVGFPEVFALKAWDTLNHVLGLPRYHVRHISASIIV